MVLGVKSFLVALASPCGVSGLDISSTFTSAFYKTMVCNLRTPEKNSSLLLTRVREHGTKS